jgi:branched-chain amino acid transport system substrate-binding protein
VGTASKKNQWVIPVMMAVVLLVLGGGAFGLYQLIKGQSPTTNQTPAASPTPGKGNFVSSTATNPKLISQGELILIDDTPDKQNGASAFAKQDWDGAMAAYQTAVDSNPNDPESRIYLNNAKARKAGNPITIAVAVPISASPNSAKEILRGVARYQEEFNQSAPSRLLEVLIANDEGQLTADSLAQDIINAPDVLGILGYGIDPGSQQALKKYQDADLATVSALTTSVVAGTQADLVAIYLKAAS